AEPDWWRECRFLTALFDDDISVARGLLSGYDGPQVDPDIRIRIGGDYKPAVCIAVERDLLQLTQLLIKYGCSLNQVGLNGASVVHTAVRRQNLPMLKLLLKSGASVHSVESNGRTALHVAACTHGDNSLEMLELLSTAGSRLDWRDSNGATPLSLACATGHWALAATLVSLGANVRIADNQGNLPLHRACALKSCDKSLVERLLDAGSPVDQPNRSGLTALTYAVISGADASIVFCLASQGADPNVRVGPLNETLPHLAVLSGDIEKVSALIRCGGSPSFANSHGESALGRALLCNRPLALWMLRVVAEVGAARRMVRNTLQAGPLDSAAAELFAEASSTPTLKRICRAAFRRKLGCRADAVASALPLPNRIREFLLLRGEV
ncbi:unnamed protein product, partial [Ixodes hexagonus]